MNNIQSRSGNGGRGSDRGVQLRRWTRCLGVLVFCLLLAAPGFGPQTRTPDVIYVPTDQAVVDEMLRMAKVAKDSVVYDLGCGDGRIVITAARRYGARGVGIDIDPDRIAESKENARAARVAGRVRFVQADLFQTDFHEATAVMLYLLTSLNVRLRPILLRQLKPGTPVVSHDFMMGDWQPDTINSVNGAAIFLWIVPARVAGVWQWAVSNGLQNERYELTLRQEFQKLIGTLMVNGKEEPFSSQLLSGDRLEFQSGPRHFSAQVVSSRQTERSPETPTADDAIINGLMTEGPREWAWTAKRTQGGGEPLE